MKTLLSAMCCMMLAHAQVCAKDILDRIQYFDVAAGALDVALLEYSRQAQVEVTTDGELLRSLKTQGIKGTESARVALEKLLRESGLTFRLVGNAVHIIRPAGAVPGARGMTHVVVAQKSLSQKT